MKTLLLIRHAKSSWDSASTKDFDRPLNARGFRDADEMSFRLQKKLSGIDVLISSSAQRARSTAEQFAAALKKDPGSIILEQALYLAPAAVFEQLIGVIDDSYTSAALFSHNPGITEFANMLTADLKTDNIPTCGIFAVQAAIDNWKKFASAEKKLLFYDYPKLHRG